MKYLIGFYFTFLLTPSIVESQVLTQWTPFGNCSETCNVGNPVRTRTRTCSPENLCQNVILNETIPCNTEVACPGSYAEWSAWSNCSEPCQSNPNVFPFQTRTRECLGASIGRVCSGPGLQIESCKVGVPCQGILSIWQEWSLCSADCRLSYVSPTRIRTRYCFGATFTGNCNEATLIDSQNCNEHIHCPGIISDWSLWSECSATCNNIAIVPMRNRVRSCIGFSTWDSNYTGCHGINKSEEISCNTNVGCPGTLVLSTESRCSYTCQLYSTDIPVKTQYFQCVGATLGAGCVGPYTRDVHCNIGVSCPGILTDWTAWGECSATCQQNSSIPQQTSSRTCNGYSFGGNCNGAVLTKSQNCNEEVYCPEGPYDEWSAWSNCSELCQSNPNEPPFRTRTRQCLGTSKDVCYGPSYQTESCKVKVSCQGFLTIWQEWSSCSAQCRLSYISPTQTRIRYCIGATFNGNCNGASLVNSQNCNDQIRCPEIISDWSSWSECSATCNNIAIVPMRNRVRSCIGFSTWDSNYTGCHGINKSEETSCNTNVGCPGTFVFSKETICSETCHSNPYYVPLKVQYRQCVGATLGAGCVGPAAINLPCNVGVPCPGSLGVWGAWGDCSATCRLDFSIPQKTSNRSCNRGFLDGKCDGELTQFQNCNEEVYCPGTLSDWSTWSACSISCNTQVNGPYQYKVRSCVGGSTWNSSYVGCNNSSLYIQQLCNQNISCPGFYSTWSAWSTCSESCQTIIKNFPSQFRTRVCQNFTLNGSCVGISYETQSCNIQVSCPGYLTDWTSWTKCPATCQQTADQYNYQYRSRQCVNTSFTGNCGGALLTDQTPCVKDVPCPVSGTWSNWYTSSANSHVSFIQCLQVYLIVSVLLFMPLFNNFFKHF